MNRNAQMRIVLAVVCWLGVLAIAKQCQGDTVSTAAVSLEWKVDSADHIYEAVVVSDAESPWEGSFDIGRPLKGNQSISSIPDEVIDRCRLKFHVYPEHRQPYPKYLSPKKPIVGTRWLLFTRGEGELLRISGAVNLTSPLEHWDTAAISALRREDDRVLATADEILQLVKKRITERHLLPPDCDPELAEQLLGGQRYPKDWPPAVYIGAKLIYTTIDVWRDTPVVPLLVPSDVPDTAADADIVIEANNPKPNSLAVTVKANASNPIPRDGEDQWLGTWQADLGDQLLTVSLRRHATMLFLVEAKHGEQRSLLSVPNGNGFGAGIWRGGRDELSLYATHLINNDWQQTRQWKANSFPLLKRNVHQRDAKSITLEGNVVFTRQLTPLVTYRYPHVHRWHVISESWPKDRASLSVRALVTLPDADEPQPLKDLVFLWRERGSPPVQGPPRPKRPRTVRTKLGDNGFEPRISVIRAGDTFEIEATGSRPIIDHGINLGWIQNLPRGFEPRLEPPLVYQETVARGEPALMHIKCNIHDDERGYVAVTDHGNIAVTNEEGFARLSLWPIGRQRLVLQHPDYDFRDAEVWADGEKLDKKGALLFLDIRDADIELRITGVKRNE